MDGKRNIEQSMKRLASALLIAFGALALHADDKTTTATTTTQPPAQNDSPLVRAAKAAQAKSSTKYNKKKIVITNANLAKSGGHITTSSAQTPLPPAPNTDMSAVEAEHQKQLAAQQAADKAKKALEDKKKREDAARAHAVLEGDDESMGLGDPAMVEKHVETASPAQPQQPPTMQTQKPPQSN